MAALAAGFNRSMQRSGCIARRDVLALNQLPASRPRAALRPGASRAWPVSLSDARETIAARRHDDNESRHTPPALDWATPAEFARRCGLRVATANPGEPEISTSERYRIGTGSETRTPDLT